MQRSQSTCFFLTIFTVSPFESKGTEANVGVGFDGRAGATVDTRSLITEPAAAFP